MRDRTADLFRAREALSQLSYSPNGLVAEAFQIEARHAKHQDGEAIKSWSDLVGLGRFELPTSPLSGVRSNQLSYRPKVRPQPHQQVMVTLAVSFSYCLDQMTCVGIRDSLNCYL